MTTTTETTDNLLGIDLPAEPTLLEEATVAVAEDAMETEPAEEAYEVVDLYPEVELPQAMLNAISADPTLWEIQEQIDYLQAELVAAQNKLQNQIMTLQNQAKEELVSQQKSADETTVMTAIEQPEMIRVLATVIRIMQSGKGGALLEAMEHIDQGNASSAMARLATTITPPAPTPVVHVTTVADTTGGGLEGEVQAITTKPAKPGKWKP